MSPVTYPGDMVSISQYYRLASGFVAKLQAAETEIEALRNEVAEQARLNGKGSERELALRTTIDQLHRQNSELEKLIINAGYIITCFDGKLALARDPWHDRRKEQP